LDFLKHKVDFLHKSIHPLICANRREFQMQLAKISENSRIKILWRKIILTLKAIRQFALFAMKSLVTLRKCLKRQNLSTQSIHETSFTPKDENSVACKADCQSAPHFHIRRKGKNFVAWRLRGFVFGFSDTL
jgi:hypothetical protein